MASTPAELNPGKGRGMWLRSLLALLNLALALGALWLGMSIPSYFRSVSPLVLEAAADGTPEMHQLAMEELESGRPGTARLLFATAGASVPEAVAKSFSTEWSQLLDEHPGYRWSGGPSPFFEQFLQQAEYLREDETAVIPTLLPKEHRQQLAGFLEQSPNRNVQRILGTRELGGWQRFYPVYSTSGHPLEATILSLALLEQSAALPEELRKPLVTAIDGAMEGNPADMEELEAIYIGILTLGRHMAWLPMKTMISRLSSTQQLLFIAQSLQEDPSRLPQLYAAMTLAKDPQAVADYLLRHGDTGWKSLHTALRMGSGALVSLLEFNRPVYHPPAIWDALPASLRESQQSFKEFAESFPGAAIGGRALAFALCGFFLVGVLRSLILKRRPVGGGNRRLLINLDSLVGGCLVMILIWVLIEPGLLEFRPNEEGTLRINLAQVVPDEPLPTTESPSQNMIDQATILVLLLFFVAQLLVFLFGLLKVAEVRRQSLTPQIKLDLLENEENLFDLGLYVGLGGTVASLVLVVLNVVDASLMAAYASTLFGIIFVAILKVGFVRPYRRRLILEKS